MICHKCNEMIEVGEAVIPERLNGSDHYWFFHPNCYAKRLQEQQDAERRLQHVREMAGQVH